MSFLPLYSGQVKIKPSLTSLTLHPVTFHLWATKVAGGRHPGITASISPRHLCTTVLLTNWFLLSNYRQLYLWASSHACVLIQCCGTQPPRLHGGPSTFDPVIMWLCGSKYVLSHKLSCPPSLRQEPGREAERPRWDMAFLMIVPITNAGGNQLFGLAGSVDTSPSRLLNHSGGGCLKVDATGGQWWPRLAIRIHVHMSDTVLHVPLSNNAHIGTMMDGMCTVNAYVWLHQLQMHGSCCSTVTP